MADKIFLNARYAFRSDTFDNWQNINPILEKGEPAVVTDGIDGEWLKIGDGVTPFNSLEWKKGPKGEQGIQGLQGVKGDKGDKGDAGVDGKDGKDAVTDQSYNPESENAQSGVAVAEAISQNETWEKITNITLEEGAVVSITKDMNGKDIGLKKFKVIVTLPTVTSSTSIWLSVNNIAAAQTATTSSSAAKPSYGITADYTYDWQFSTCTANASTTANATIYSTPYGRRVDNGEIPFPCTSIKLSLNSTFTSGLPTGATIDIWGVKE